MKLARIMMIVLFVTPAYSAGEWKWRAREHFETHTIEQGATEAEYKGLSNTINYWHEIPFDRSIGVAFGPVIGDATREGTGLETEIGRKIKLQTVGVEYKKWYSQDIPAFIRLGANYQRLETQGSVGDVSGTGIYYGVGYEFIVRGVGIALEYAIRKSNLDSGVSVESVTPSIGFHFYPFL